MKLNVLSLFDGISCGRLALERAGIKIEKYYASEIDKFAINIARKNYPDTIHIGDITNIKGDYLPKINLIIGGSPCQGFSFAGKQLNFDDPRSKLFFEFVRLTKECKPDYFLLENVKMKKEYQDVISKHLGVEPIEINSALVSAQNRKRLYWTNIPNVEQPKDRGIFLKDIIAWSRSTRYPKDKPKYVESRATITGKANTLTTGDGCGSFSSKNLIVDREKSYCLDANYHKGTNIDQYLKKKRRQIVFTNEEMTQFRKLTPIECERLQTLPDNYTEGISNAQIYKAIGNSWTVNVVAHIFENLKDKNQTKMEI